MEKAIEDMKEKVANPAPEVGIDIEKIKQEYQNDFEEVRNASSKVASKVDDIKEIMFKTYEIVTDLKYKV